MNDRTCESCEYWNKDWVMCDMTQTDRRKLGCPDRLTVLLEEIETNQAKDEPAKVVDWTAFPPKLVYVSGPYRDKSPWKVEQNIRRAEEVGEKLVRLGCYPIIPHSNTRGYFDNRLQPELFWLAGTLEIVKRLRPGDGICLVDGWEKSSGSNMEVSIAINAGLDKVEV